MWNPDSERLPENYPAEYVERVVLKDGQDVLIRPILPDDASKLQAAFKRLSPQSVYLRFLETFTELSDKQAHDFSHVDYRKKMAFVAEVVDEEDAQIIGVARYAMLGEGRPGFAESAIVVVDEYQGRGIGTFLLDRLLRYAKSHGVEAFLATVHHTNARIMGFIRRSGFKTEKTMLEPGVWEISLRFED